MQCTMDQGIENLCCH